MQVPARDQGHGIHHGIFEVILKEKAKKLGQKFTHIGNKTPD